MGLRAFRTVSMGALAIRRPTPTWDFIIINKGLIKPPRRGKPAPLCFRILVRFLSQVRKKESKEERKGEKKQIWLSTD